MPQAKDKKRVLKAASYLQGSSHTTVSWFPNWNFAGQKGLEWNIQSDEKQGPTTKIILPSKGIIQNRKTGKELPRQEKTNGGHHH